MIKTTVVHVTSFRFACLPSTTASPLAGLHPLRSGRRSNTVSFTDLDLSCFCLFPVAHLMSHFYSAVQEQIMEVLRACAEEKSWRVRYMMVRNLEGISKDPMSRSQVFNE